MPLASVNAPIIPEVRDRDVNRKLQLYGISSAFANGKVPSNRQIDVALNSVLGSRFLNNPPDNLSSESKEIFRDVKEVIANARNLVLVKNEGNLLQEFIWEAEHASKPSSSYQPTASVDRDAEKQRGGQAYEDLQTLGTLLITNGQFRKLLSDATILLRDIASDAAQRGVDTIRPSGDQLAQIDEPAPEGVWHEKPDISKGKIKSRLQSGAKESHAIGTGSADGTPLVSQPVGVPNGRPTEAADGGVDARASKEKGRTQDMADKTKAFFTEKIPQERREQTVWRLKKMIVEIQGHSDYQRAIDSLLSLAETYAERWRDAARRGTGQMRGARDESGMKSLESKFRTLIERFANCTSTEDLFDSIRKISRDADNDERLRDWFRAMARYIRKCLREQGYVLQDEATEEWQRLHTEGRYLFSERYRDDWDRVIGELKFIIDQFDQDPLNRALKQSLQKLFYDLGYDESGKLAFKEDVAKDLTGIILPAIFENLHYVPIPRIEVSDPMVDVVVENLAIECDNLMPNVVEFSMDNYWRWGRKKIGSKRDTKVMISATGMQTDWKDVSYYVKKKRGFPQITDKGVMDVFLGGEGFSFRIIGSNIRDEDSRQFIKPEQVSVTIRHLDVRLKQSRHKILFGLSKPLLLSVLRPAVQKALEKQIRDYFVKADSFAYEVDKEVQRTREIARNDPEDTRNIYSHYLSAVRKRLMDIKQQGQKQREEKKATTETQTNVAMTKNDMMFKDIRLPGAISSKASEYKDLAMKGERWESPVFSIGTASETTGLPKLAAITRKSHSIAPYSRRPEAEYQPGRRPVDEAATNLTSAPNAMSYGSVDGPVHAPREDGQLGGAKVDRVYTILGTPCPV
ncbi:hypothetical protein VTO42DRAFT_399 [Malbranchea cinnamomea]